MNGQLVQSDLERQFHLAMLDIYRIAKAKLNYTASYFLRMVGEQGESRQPALSSTPLRCPTASRDCTSAGASTSQSRRTFSVPSSWGSSPRRSEQSRAAVSKKLAATRPGGRCLGFSVYDQRAL